MKNIRTLMFSGMAILAGIFASCNEEEFQPGPKVDGQEVYFDASTPSSFTIESENSITITVMRVVADEDLDVNVLVDKERMAEEDQELFDCPESVSFKAGENKAEYVINFTGALAEGTDYEIGLMLDDVDNTTPYGLNTVYFTVAINPWNSLGTGKYRDDWFGPLWGATEPVEIDIEIYESKSEPGLYMVKEMFGWNFLTEFFGGTQDAIIGEGYVESYTPTDIQFDCTDPNNVHLPMQFSGITDTELGDLYIAMLQGATGTLENGIITFSTNGLFCGNSEMYGLQANTDGMFRIVLPGYEVTDYSLAAEYAGMRVASDNETASAVIDFTYGKDVTGIKYVFASGNVENSAGEYITGIVDGTAENVYEVENFIAGGETVSIEAALTPGIQTIVAVPMDKDNKPLEDNAAVSSFYFPGLGSTETPECDVEVAMYKVSEYAAASDYVEACPDYSSAVYEITGSGIKSMKSYLNTKEIVESAPDMGLTYEDLVMEYGTDFNADKLAELNSTGKLWNISIKLEAGTTYTMLVYAENDYGKTKLVTADFTTDEIPYEGTLVIGDYKMTCTLDDGKGGTVNIGNIFTVSPRVAGTETEYAVTNLAIENGASWYATFDPDANTLTLDGTEVGYETYGPSFGATYGYYDAEKTLVYGIYSFASEQSDGSDPCVFSVDAATNQVSALTTDLMVPVFNASTGRQEGVYSSFSAGTGVSLYTGESAGTQNLSPASAGQILAPASVKIEKLPAQMPVRHTAGFEPRTKTLDINHHTGMTGLRTLKVETGVCEPLPHKGFSRHSVSPVAVAR